MREQLIDIYLDWVNNYLTISAFAEHHGLRMSEAKVLIDLCREITKNNHPEA